MERTGNKWTEVTGEVTLLVGDENRPTEVSIIINCNSQRIELKRDSWNYYHLKLLDS